MRRRSAAAARALLRLALALALGFAGALPAAASRPCAGAALCLCHGDHFTCYDVPFHRFPETAAGVRHVSVWGARLLALAEPALEGRALRTLVLAASRLHALHPRSLASMKSTLASLDLGYNEFSELPLEALRQLRVLNWLNLQNNDIDDLDSTADWGSLKESLSSLSLSNNRLSVLRDGTLSSLRALVHLEIDGNRLSAVHSNALPPATAVLRLGDNLLSTVPCAALVHLPRLAHLHLRSNALHIRSDRGICHRDLSSTQRFHIDTLDLSHNELDDHYDFDMFPRPRLRRLILDFNLFTAIPVFVLDIGRMETLSISHNKITRLTDNVVYALKRSLEQLDLDRNELTEIKASVKQFVHLRHLSLAYNFIEEVAELPPRLRSLSLAGNYLSEVPTALMRLAPGTINYLDLGYNRLIHMKSEWFGAWANSLTTLILKGNRVSTLAANAFPARLPLRELVLGFGELYTISAVSLEKLRDLTALDLSSSLLSGRFPFDVRLERLAWLALDNNNIYRVSAGDLQKIPSLEYLNLDYNKIVEFPSETNTLDHTYKLKELRLSYNYVYRINGDFFTNLEELQSLDLSYNRMRNVTEGTFVNLSNLVFLSLAGNLIEYITAAAFRNLAKLEMLDLQENELVEFATEYFENVSNADIELSVNASRNRISSLIGGNVVPINILDLSHNLLEVLPKSFFESIGSHVLCLILSHNRLMYIDNFGPLPKLVTLSLRDNNVTVIKKRTFVDMLELQVLDLSHNHLSALAVEQFSGLMRLRELHLDASGLRSLPRDVFKNTVIEYLNLNDNFLVVYPGSALAQVGFTLRRLEMARNNIEHLDAAVFHVTAFLHELSLARNALTVLADNVFAALTRLRRLDLSHNVLKANFRELFHNVPRLRILTLAGAGLRAVPILPLSDLTDLDLSENRIVACRETDLLRLVNLRTLSLARNRLTSLQPAAWMVLPRLAELDLSHNPIVRIARGSLDGLGRLLRLQIAHMLHLEAIEPRAFRSLSVLRSLEIDLPLDERLIIELVAATPYVETLTLHVREVVLDRQLIGMRAARLRTLELRGASLRIVSADAFAALGEQQALALRLVETGVTTLPEGLVLPLARVPHLALHLIDNALPELSPAVLYPNFTGWNRFGTKLISGGLVVSGGALRCGCGAAWAGAWLRRWAREAGAAGGGGPAAARALARASRCARPAPAAPLPLVALEADDAACRASALAARAPARRPPPPASVDAALAPFLWIVLLHSLS